MDKYIITICLVAALTYLVEGATRHELLGALGRTGAQVRGDSIRRLNSAARNAITASTNQEQRNCIQTEIRAGHQDLNRDLVLAERTAGQEAVTRTDADLAGLTVEQVNQGLRERLQAAVAANLEKHVDGIQQC